MVYKIILAVVFVCMQTLAMADTTQDKEEYCSDIAELAYNIQGARQSGASPERLLAIANTAETPSLKKLVKTITLQAFEVPRFSTEQFQQQASNDFRESMFLRCMKVK